MRIGRSRLSLSARSIAAPSLHLSHAHSLPLASPPLHLSIPNHSFPSRKPIRSTLTSPLSCNLPFAYNRPRLFLAYSPPPTEWVGINALLYYGPTLVASIGLQGEEMSLLVSGGIGVAQFVAVLPAIAYIDRWGECGFHPCPEYPLHPCPCRVE